MMQMDELFPVSFKMDFDETTQGQKKECLVSRNPTDPTFLGLLDIFWGHVRISVFLMIFMLFVYKNIIQKKCVPTYRP